MALINYVKRENATGQIADIYEKIEQRMNKIPNVVQFHSASPELFPKFMSVIGHFFDHPTLDSVTVAYIRFLISFHEKGEYCVRLQSLALKSFGVSEEQLNKAKENYYNLQLDEKRKALVCFILDEIFDKLVNTEEKLKQLDELGWTEKDIYEASVLAALQKGMVRVITAFKLEFDY